MTVQIQQGRPKDRLNGLAALEESLLADHEQTVTAIVTFRVAKIVDDLKADVEYPVVYMKAIEPILGEAEQHAVDLQMAAWSARKRAGEKHVRTEKVGTPPEERAVPRVTVQTARGAVVRVSHRALRRLGLKP